MFVHCVYFWLKPTLTEAEVRQFVAGATSISKLKSVRHGWLGKPASTDRPIIDRSYSYALVVAFDDLAGHDAYQVDPVHDKFREISHLWEKVKIYDFET